MNKTLFEKIENNSELNRQDLIEMLSLEEPADLQRLYAAAYQIKLKNIGKKVYLRGLIEYSNICTKNCYYCGIRRDNHKVKRYTLSEDEALNAAGLASQANFGSIVIQSGERSDQQFTDNIESMVRKIYEKYGENLGITLSTGEQNEEVYKRWFEAGARRFLLRIETSDPKLYQHLHPTDHSYEKRLACIRLLQSIGYQTGTGVMIGLPGQTIENLADDLLFFRDMDIDMIGMGPYLVHPDTPLAQQMPGFEHKKEHQLELGLKMIASARILLKDVNIASTTALQALRGDGRELGLAAGANVIMPNITENRYRESYQLYEGKPGQNQDAQNVLAELFAGIDALGESVAFGEQGDPKHFFRRKKC